MMSGLFVPVLEELSIFVSNMLVTLKETRYHDNELAWAKNFLADRSVILPVFTEVGAGPVY